MCMGFGCNAVGVTGCRIIDSRRERLIAMLTNSFVPCNGRFPLLIAIISMFFAAGAGGVLSAGLLLGIIVLGIAVSLLCSRLLSATLLRGTPSSFTLELPPYRTPQVGKVIVRSVVERTLVVLTRAIKVSAPAGLIIWLLANIDAGGVSVLMRCAGALDPVGRFLGMDGVILIAFILALPANEIVLPIMLMAYTAGGTLMNTDNLMAVGEVLRANGWTNVTALCVMLFSLMHWPCATTLMTIKKESGEWKWAAAGFLMPTLTGTIICAAVASIARLL